VFTELMILLGIHFLRELTLNILICRFFIIVTGELPKKLDFLKYAALLTFLLLIR